MATLVSESRAILDRQLRRGAVSRRAACLANRESAPVLSSVEGLMVAFASPTHAVPDLPPYDPEQSLSLGAACRLGLVPGHDGRRATPAEARAWARTGFAVRPLGPRYLFPVATVRGGLRTTVPWCSAWVRFIAAALAADPGPIDGRAAVGITIE
jgi:hypothetical protein